MHTKTSNYKQVSFQDVVNDFFNFATIAEKTVKSQLFDTTLKANIFELENSYSITIAIPGIKKQDIDINIEKNTLTLKVNNQSTKEQDDFLNKEYDYTNAKRTFKLTRAIDTDSIKAEIKNGILTINLDKKPAFIPKTIEIK